MLNYCRVMEKIGARPLDRVELTFRQLLELRAHLKVCAKCAGIADAVRRLDKPRIGPAPEVN